MIGLYCECLSQFRISLNNKSKVTAVFILWRLLHSSGKETECNTTKYYGLRWVKLFTYYLLLRRSDPKWISTAEIRERHWSPCCLPVKDLEIPQVSLNSLDPATSAYRSSADWESKVHYLSLIVYQHNM